MSKPIAIIGLGPAGISAAIQLHRYGFRPRIFEPSASPGLLRNANSVENYPGFPSGITGPGLYNYFRQQLASYSPDIVQKRVTRIVADEEMFIVDSGDSTGRFKYVILATGTQSVKLDIPHPPHRVFYEVVEVPDKFNKIIIAGGGDAAFDYALNLKKRGKDVSIICRSAQPKCLGLLEKRCQDTGIQVTPGTALLAANETESGLALELEHGGRANADALLCALGRVPVVDMLDDDLQKTLDTGGNIAGLFPAGDVKNGNMRQVGIAVGDGLKAAMRIKELIG